MKPKRPRRKKLRSLQEMEKDLQALVQKTRESIRELACSIGKLEESFIESEVLQLEVRGTLQQLDDFIPRWEARHVSLDPWRNRLKALRMKLTVEEVHEL